MIDPLERVPELAERFGIRVALVQKDPSNCPNPACDGGVVPVVGMDEFGNVDTTDCPVCS